MTRLGTLSTLAVMTLAVMTLAALGPVAIAGPATGPAVAATAGAEPMSYCTTTLGVVVAVDFAHFGGPVLRSCGTTPATGYALLNQGGWHTTGTEHDGPGFVCRIGYAGFHGGAQYPTPSQQACVLTPPYSAYWAFWYANRGQNTWSYSQAGAMSTNAEPGSVELWVFGGTSSGGTSGSAVPSISPGSLRATNPGKMATVRHDGLPRQTTTAPRETSPASTQATPAQTRGPGKAATAAPSGRATIVDAPPTTASAPASHGSATPAIIALVIVLVLAAVGIVAVLRRPRRER